MICNYYDLDYKPWQLASMLDLSYSEATNAVGLYSILDDIEAANPSIECHAMLSLPFFILKSTVIIPQLTNGNPVVIGDSNTFSEGHAFVVTGISQSGMYVHDPSGAWFDNPRINHYIPWSDLSNFIQTINSINCFWIEGNTATTSNISFEIEPTQSLCKNSYGGIHSNQFYWDGEYNDYGYKYNELTPGDYYPTDPVFLNQFSMADNIGIRATAYNVSVNNSIQQAKLRARVYRGNTLIVTKDGCMKNIAVNSGESYSTSFYLPENAPVNTTLDTGGLILEASQLQQPGLYKVRLDLLSVNDVEYDHLEFMFNLASMNYASLEVIATPQNQIEIPFGSNGSATLRIFNRGNLSDNFKVYKNSINPQNLITTTNALTPNSYSDQVVTLDTNTLSIGATGSKQFYIVSNLDKAKIWLSTFTYVIVPANPVAIAATNITQTGFQANWNSSTGATSYQLDVSTNNEFSSFVTGYNNLSVNGTNQSVTGLTAGTTYYYRVRAVNANGTSGNSNIITVLTVPPNPVATDATTITNTSFQANWNAATSATSYKLDVSLNNAFSSFVAGYNNLTVNGTSQSVTGLTQGTQYYYRVRAVNASGTSGSSNTILVTTPEPPPAPVAIAATNITQTGFQANWNASTGATSYQLDVSTNNEFSSFVTGYNNLTVNGTNQSVTGLTAGTTYYYRVRAVNANGTSGNSNIISTLTIPPNPVAIAATNITQTGFQANWNASTGATSYQLDVSLNNSFSSFVTGYNNLTVNGTNQSVTGLTQGTQYYYRVRSVNASGTSGSSNTILVTTPEPPPAPVAITATNITQTGFQANWNASTGATSYQLDVSTNNEFSSFVTGYNNLSVNGTNQSVTGLTAGTTYYYRVRAVNANGTSGNSNIITVLTVPPNPVATDATTITNTSFQANWNAATSATSYKLDVSLNNAFSSFVAGYNNLTVNGTSQSVTGLTQGTQYYYRVRAVNASGTSGSSNTILVTTPEPPPAPVAIAATNITQTGFQANWNASTGATSYQLDVSTNNEFSSFVTGYNNLTVNGTNQSVTGLTAGTTYYYRVRAVNANGTSGNSNIISTLTIPPNPVAIAATNITQTGFQANWNASTGATSYQLDVSLNNSFSSFVTGYNNLTVDGTNQSVTGLTAGTTYYYRVRAVNANGTSGNSNVVSALTVPPNPVALDATNVTNTSFQANWNASTSATSYRLDVSTSNSFSSFVTGYNNLTVNGTNQSVTGLTQGTQYYYRMRAVNASGSSDNSNVQPVTTTAPPDPPSNLSTTEITQTSFRASWNAVNGATSYKLDVSTNISFSSFVPGYNNLTVNNMTKVVSGLNPGSMYYWRVRAVNANGTSGNSNIITVLTVPPNPVAVEATTITNTSFQANWLAATSATSYKLDVSLNNAFSSFVAGYNNLTVNGTSQSVTGLPQGTQYYYRVRAVNASGTSGNSNTILVTTPEPPPAPVAIAATNITQTGFQANWNTSTGATSYQLDVSTNNEFSSFVTGYNNLTVTGTNQIVTGLTAGTTYYYRVRAVNANGTSGNSNVISTLTVPPNPVATGATNITQTSFQANWNASTGATSYQLDVSLNNSFSSFVTGYNNLTVNGTNQSVTGLTQGTQYYYRVRSVNASGESGNSNIIEVTMPVSSDDPNNVPVVTELIGCYPNPFNPTTTIKFSLDGPQRVLIQIFDISGRIVSTLLDETRNKGTYTVTWNGMDNHGNSLASGIYLIQMKAGTYTVTRKITMLK
jgi:inner membrane protein involved in colicin E2 resistance